MFSLFKQPKDTFIDSEREERMKRNEERMQKIKEEMGEKYILHPVHTKTKLEKPRY